MSVKGSNRPQTRECKACGEQIPRGSRVCPECGQNPNRKTPQKENPKISLNCINCQEEIPEGENPCSQCGRNPFIKFEKLSEEQIKAFLRYAYNLGYKSRDGLPYLPE